MSAERLGVDRIDLFLIHWPNPWRNRYVDAFQGLVDLMEAGLVRAVGLSNFKPEHTQRVIDATGVTPDVNQIELNPRVTREAVRAYHAERGIVTESWSPIGKGSDLLADPVITAIAVAARADPGPDRPALAHRARARPRAQVVEPGAAGSEPRRSSTSPSRPTS